MANYQSCHQERDQDHRQKAPPHPIPHPSCRNVTPLKNDSGGREGDSRAPSPSKCPSSGSKVVNNATGHGAKAPDRGLMVMYVLS
jgi:hypothetical protein